MTIAKTAVAELIRRTKSISMAAILLPAAIAIIATTILTTVVPARASNSVRHGHPVSHRHHRRAHREVRTGTVLYHALLLEDADTGRIIYDYNGGIEWPPASMAKMMLLMVAEDQIKAGRFHLNSPATISANAAFTGGSRLGPCRRGDPARRIDEGRAYPLGQRRRGRGG
jgi:D-alanyl-D-alanine carboxypeptidase